MNEVNGLDMSDKIKINHKVKSDQLRKMKKKLKNIVPISKLKEMLAQEKYYKVDWRDYRGYDGVDDSAYSRDIGKQEARVELLEELIREYDKKRSL